MSTLSGGQGNIITNGLVLRLDAANPRSYQSGSLIWNDLSGNNYTGSLQSGSIYNTGPNVQNIFFSGSGNATPGVGIGSNVNLGNILNIGTGGFTINCWVRVSAAQDQYIFSKAFYGGQNYRYGFSLTAGGKISAFVQGNGGSDIAPISTTTLSLDTWYMTSMVINRSSSIQLYINGIQEALIGTATISQWAGLDFQSTNPARWGSYTFSDNISPNLVLNGRIALGQVYNRALNQSEITQNYNATRARFGV
jgi:hypothetical protein